MAVRIRLMKAVFFFREESKVGLIAKMPILASVRGQHMVTHINVGGTSFSRPGSSVEGAQFAFKSTDQ